jgi:hypothetical protein
VASNDDEMDELDDEVAMISNKTATTTIKKSDIVAVEDV